MLYNYKVRPMYFKNYLTGTRKASSKSILLIVAIYIVSSILCKKCFGKAALTLNFDGHD